MRLNIDRNLVKQLVSGQLPNKSRHLDELTHEPSIWQCDTGQCLSCFDSCQFVLSIDHIVNGQCKRCGFAKTRLRHPSLPFDRLPYPTRAICRRIRTYVRTLGQSRDNQTKRCWPYSMSMGLCPTRASRAREPRYNDLLARCLNFPLIYSQFHVIFLIITPNME